MPDWISIVPDASSYLAETGALDAGEASAITLAWQLRDSSLLILDEKRGRKVATALGLGYLHDISWHCRKGQFLNGGLLRRFDRRRRCKWISTGLGSSLKHCSTDFSSLPDSGGL